MAQVRSGDDSASAAGSNWLGGALFLGLAGALHEIEFEALAYPVGLVGGWLLADVLIAPRVRRFGRHTLPDFFSARYGNHAPRLIGTFVLLTVLFGFLTAQLYGIGTIVVHQLDIAFNEAVFIGLAGTLVSSLLIRHRNLVLPLAACVVAAGAYFATALALRAADNPTSGPNGDATAHLGALELTALFACLAVGVATMPRIGMQSITAPSVNTARHATKVDFLFAVPVVLFANTFTEAAGQGIESDAMVLTAPATAGISPVFTALIAIGALAIFLLTATRLLRTILSLLTDEKPGTEKSARAIAAIGGMVLFGVAAAYAAGTEPASILTMMAWGLSLAASGLFAPLVLGLWWKRTSALGATFGIAAGFGVCLFYLIGTQYFPDRFAALFGSDTWWGIDNVAAGLFGIPVALTVTILVSLVTPAPSPEMQEFIASLRRPRGMPANRARSAE